MLKSAYANGDAIRYKYHYLGLVTDIFVDDNVATEYATYGFGYSSNGTPTHYSDGPTATRYDYSYDSIGRLIRTNISNSKTNAYKGATEYGYDVRNNLTSITNDIGGVAYKQEYLYSATTDVAESAAHAKDNLPTQYKYLDIRMNYYHDSLNRLYKRAVGAENNQITNQYYYTTTTGADGVTYYSTQLNCEIIEGISYHFGYDAVGNITSIKRGTGLNTTQSPYRTYTYDGLNRMTSETNGISNYTSTYTYDGLGNITQKFNTLSGANHSKVDYTYSSSSATGWNNLLTKLTFTDYTNNTTKEETINYDAIGNPISYRGATLSWYGRQLTQFVKNGVTTKFTYDANGLRTSKTVNGSKTEYQYVGDKLFYEKRGDGNSFYYFYDSYGKLSALYHYVNGTKVPYHVVTNAQGDVVALYNWTGNTKVAEYSYDAWGNCTIVSDTTSTHIATLNPFRYRGYYRDTDLGLYYLQSRYYDSEIGRFINADGTLNGNGDIMGFNMFAYCSNNPVMFSDPNGNSLVAICVLYFIAGATIIGSGCYAASKIANPPYTPSKTPYNSETVDITEKLDTAMQENAQALKDYSNEHNLIETTSYFVEKVKPGGEWDFKSQDDWNLDPSTTYSYNGTPLRYDDVGNIHYGYVGRVIYEESTLLLAGGVVQIYAGSSRWYFCNTNFDDSQDQWAISYGSLLWDMGVAH